jgi:hypothetical protein
MRWKTSPLLKLLNRIANGTFFCPIQLPPVIEVTGSQASCEAGHLSFEKKEYRKAKQAGKRCYG